MTPYTLVKFCCVLTYPPYIKCDIVIAHNGDEPPKVYNEYFLVNFLTS